MNSLLELISTLFTDNLLLCLLLMFISGFLTSLTPCALSSVSLLIGYVSGGNLDTKKSFKFSLIFSLGMILTFTTLGIISSYIGGYLSKTGSIWYIFLGILMALMSLQMWGIINVSDKCGFGDKIQKKGFIGAFLLGIASTLFASACSTPVLVVILALVANTTIINAILMLLVYALGYSIVLILAGTFTTYIKNLSKSDKFSKFSDVSKIILGILMLLMAYYMFYVAFQ